MPAGEAASPRAVPFHLPLRVCRAKLPQREVCDAALLSEINALAALQARDVETGEVAIVAQARGVEVQAVVRAVRVTFFLDGGDGRDLLANVVGGAAPDVGGEDVEPVELFLEICGVTLGNFPSCQAGAPCASFHLVFAGVRVRGQVPHVGDVDDVVDLIAAVFEGAPEDVFKDIGA